MTTSTRTGGVSLTRPTADDVLALDHHWYHRIDLADGRSTPGWVDLRGVVHTPDLPRDLTGQRALDVGTYDGFWALELERRGAESIGLDIDEIPPPDTPLVHRPRIAAEVQGRTPGAGFGVVTAHLGSAARRVARNVYDVTVDDLDGPVDLVFVGAMLLHLRDPVGALEQLRTVLRPGGSLVLFETVDQRTMRRKEPLARFLAWDTTWTWWHPNPAALEAWVRTAGYADVRRGRSVLVQPADGPPQRFLSVSARA